MAYRSETDKARASLTKYCIGYGVDLGFGGDKIIPSAIGVDLPKPYAKTGYDPVQLGGDAANLYWFKDEVLDYVFSSHLLEDFEDTTSVLTEWSRVLKVGGYLILYLPDEQVYRADCAAKGLIGNTAHKNENFNLDWVLQCADAVGNLELVHNTGIVIDYSFEVVFRKRSI